MFESDYMVHSAEAKEIVVPSEERAIHRGIGKKVSPIFEGMGINIGDMYKHKTAGRFFVVKGFEGNAVVCVHQLANGILKEKSELGYLFKSDMVLLEACEPQYLHSFLLQPHRVEKQVLNRVDIFRLFKSNLNIKQIGEGRYIRFCKEDIAREYPWYSL